MAEAAKRRVKAIGSQLAPPRQSKGEVGTPQSMPSIHEVAGKSNGPRALAKVVIITGANSALGIGRASAHQFAQNGAQAIYFCDRDDSNLEAHGQEIKSLWPGVHVHTSRFDAADETAVKEVIADAMRRYGRLDVFFANAAITGAHTGFMEIEAADFLETLRVNTLSCFLAAKHAAPAMQKTGPGKDEASGSIIMTASVAGLRSNAGGTPYSASKAAVVSLAQTMAYQLAGTGVRVNALCPGIIETGMTAPVFDMARARGRVNRIGQLNPLKRYGHADEIARVALFLGSDEGSYVNGQSWAVDGGLSAGHPYVPGRIA